MELHSRVKALVNTYGIDAVAEAVLSMANGPGSAPARHGDPSTSKASAKRETDVLKFGVKNRKAKLLRAFIDPSTDHEATIKVVGSLPAHDTRFEGTRRRCSDLRPPGPIQYIEDSKTRRVNPGSDSESIVWQLTVAGRQALHNLSVDSVTK
jgi:hypothetical protein